MSGGEVRSVDVAVRHRQRYLAVLGLETDPERRRWAFPSVELPVGVERDEAVQVALRERFALDVGRVTALPVDPEGLVLVCDVGEPAPVHGGLLGMWLTVREMRRLRWAPGGSEIVAALSSATPGL